MSLRILVVGAGAVGGYFGGRLAEAGRDVSFLVRPRRAEALRCDGLHIDSPQGDLCLQPQLVTADALGGPYDVILLGVKAYALDAAIADFAAAVGPQTLILPALNGMAHIDRLVERFGDGPVLGGVCLVAAELDENGRIQQSGAMRFMAYGERSGAVTDRIQTLDQTLRGAGFDTTLSPDIVQAMWDKWVQLAALGAATCLFRGAVGQIVAAPGGADMSRAMVDGCAEIARACGHPPSDAFLAQRQADMARAGSPLTASMYRDLKKGAPVEADHIVGDLLRRGREHGVDVALLQAAYVNLRVYQDVLDHAESAPRR